MANAVRPLLPAALGIALASSPAAAEDFWEIKRSSTGACTMASQHGDPAGREADTLIAFVYDPALDSLSFYTANPKWSHLQKREGSPGALHLRFDGAGGYTEWISEQASMREEGDNRRVIVGHWGRDYSAELAKALTSSRHVSVTYGQSDLGKFDLSDAAQAYGQLRKCVERG